MKHLITAPVLTAVAVVGLAVPVSAAHVTTLPRCRSGHLAVTLAQPSGAAGTTYYRLRFTSTAQAACTLTGWPGVSFVSAPAGLRVGLPAVRDRLAPVRAVALLPGHAATATLQVIQARNYPAPVCGPVRVSWLLVYAPGAYRAHALPLDAWACTKPVRVLSVTAVQAARAAQ